MNSYSKKLSNSMYSMDKRTKRIRLFFYFLLNTSHHGHFIFSPSLAWELAGIVEDGA